MHPFYFGQQGVPFQWMLAKNDFHTCRAKAWNSLCSDVITTDGINSFKHKLKDNFFQEEKDMCSTQGESLCSSSPNISEHNNFVCQ